MKAALLSRHGGNEVLSVGSLPDPLPGPGEIRVRVLAAALNRLDLFVRNGIPGVPIEFPHVPGADGCGRVEAVGAGVTGFAVGERIVLQPGLSCGTCEFCRAGETCLCVDYEILGEHRSGTLAERVVVPAANVWKAPAHLTNEEAAAFPLAAMTAWRMLVTRAARQAGRERSRPRDRRRRLDLRAPDRSALGVSLVIATSGSDEKLERALKLGADVALDYRSVDVGRKVRELTGKRGVDVVVDSVGAATWRASLTAAAKKGRIVTCGATSGPNPEEEIRIIFWKQLSILGSTMGTDAEFRALRDAVERRRVLPVVDEVFPLHDVRAAYARLEEGKGFGKVVVRIPE